MTRPLLALAVTTALLVSGTACSTGAATTTDPDTVTLLVGDQIAGARPLLEAAGELDDLPYAIEWSTFTSGPPLLEAVHAGAVDIGQVGNAPPVFAAAAGSDIRIVAAFDSSPKGSSVLVPPDSAITDPADLRGATVAVARGSSAHAHLLGVLDGEGIGFDELEVEYLQPADALAAFSEGRVDAWAVWDPYVAQAESLAGARILVDAEGYSNTYSFQVANAAVLEDPAKEAALEDYVERIHRAVLWSREHPERYAEVWSQHSGLPVEITRVAAQRRAATPRPVDDALVDSEQALADAFAEAGEIPSAPDIADVADDRFNHLVPSG
ncbi:ABC transporter substrate-binding protein [Marinactinospora thermotolerans]|uniref:Putative aliphatic sulfonates-binding protein n=1 Tax=Marinactinospora thermotolerans DSM 45154 TaxID=1122192 RepID=A0A1T4NSH6_9ACTN|nr:ABC transporter substrate-binding protein [Marinactinospora thermotolerans]SJZ82075.1 sulfonate transport system substrate-binding protein [Marinactinospora thermotolerans DSM 45154]